MLRSGDTFTRVTLTIVPCMARVCSWKIMLSSFCSRRAILFCLVSCIKLLNNGLRLQSYTFFFVTLPSMMANLLRLGKKKNKFFCFALDFS